MNRREKWVRYVEENQHRRKSSTPKLEGLKSSRVRSARKTSQGIIRFVKFLETAGTFLAQRGSEAAKVYSQTLAKADETLEEETQQIVRKAVNTLLQFEELQYRLGVRISRNRLDARIGDKWISFVVLDISNPDEKLSELDVAVLLGDLHRAGIPFKIISRLRKTVGEVAAVADWVERQFAERREDWNKIEGAGLDPDSWIENLRWLVDFIAGVHQDWKSWLVLPVDGLSRRLTKKFRRLGRTAVYELVFELFQNLDEYNEESEEFFRAILASIQQGEEPFETILPSWFEIKDSHIKTSDDIFISGINLVTLGADIAKVEIKGQRRRKPAEELVIRDLDWLRHLLDVCLSDEGRSDQIWVVASQLPVQDRRGMISNVRRHTRTYGASWNEQGVLQLPYDRTVAEQRYLQILSKVTTFLRKNPRVPAFQQTYNLLLKSGSNAELHRLINRVELVLSRESVWFERVGMRHEQWGTFRSMLPVVWPRDVIEEHGIPRSTMPIPDPELHSLFFEDRYIPSPVGAVVGRLDNGTPLVVGPLHWGVIGTTSVGKSMFMKNVCAMLYPIDPLNTEIFLIDMVDAKPGMDLRGWYTLLVELFGGVAVFPQKYKSPQVMRDALDGMGFKKVFLYMPSKEVRNIEDYDHVFLDFIVNRMTSGNVRRRIVAIDELNRWLRVSEDSRVATFIQDIMDQGSKYNTTCMYTLKTLEGPMRGLPESWANLKAITQHWLIFDTPDPESVPETIGFPPRSAETVLRADQIVNAIRAIRPHGGLTPQELVLGRCVLVTGDVVSPAKIVVPPGLLEALQRKKDTEWGP